MIDWKYNPDNYNAEGYQLVPPGKYHVRIEDAEEMVSRTGKDMIRLRLKVSGYDSNIWHYMVFDKSSPEDNKGTMRAVVQFFLRRKEQGGLPAWQEHPIPKPMQTDDFAPKAFNPEEDIPF